MQNPKYINIESVLERYQASAEYLSKFIATPNFSFTAGSGLSELSNAFEAKVVIPYQEIPGLPISSVSGHSGELRLLKHNDKSCLYFAGRVHLYEGYSLIDTLFNVAISHLLGCGDIVISNAAGGLNPNYKAGDIMLIEDTLNFLSCDIVSNDITNDLAFAPFGGNNSAQYLNNLKSALIDSGIKHHSGCLMAVTGPNYETPAEIRAYRRLTADAMGMSTVLELKAAQMLGHNAVGLSLISNELRDVNTVALDHKHVVDAAKSAETTLIRILEVLFR